MTVKVWQVSIAEFAQYGGDLWRAPGESSDPRDENVLAVRATWQHELGVGRVHEADQDLAGASCIERGESAKEVVLALLEYLLVGGHTKQ